jgi:hypothetical protein
LDLRCRLVSPEALAQTALLDLAVEGANEGVLNIVI